MPAQTLAIQKLRDELGEWAGGCGNRRTNLQAGTDTPTKPGSWKLCREILNAGAKRRAYDRLLKSFPMICANITTLAITARGGDRTQLRLSFVRVADRIRQADWDAILA